MRGQGIAKLPSLYYIIPRVSYRFWRFVAYRALEMGHPHFERFLSLGKTQVLGDGSSGKP
jgi:hypothetical protein